MNTTEWEALRAFRLQVYTRFGCRRDALFEALDAVLSAPTLETPAHLSLAATCHLSSRMGQPLRCPQCRNHGPGAPGTKDCLVSARATREALVRRRRPRLAASGRAGDAETSPDRGSYHHPYRHSHGQPIVAGWNSSWFVQAPLRCSSWTAPLRVRRIMPGENLNTVAAEQIRSWLAQAGPQNTGPQNTGPQNTGPIVTFDAGYDAVQLRLARADLQVGLLVRLRAGRCFYADPTAQPATGRPRRHGARVRL